MSNPGNLCPAVTSITCTMERGKFPGDEDPCYLAQKAEVAMRLPRRIVTKTGLVRFLNQLVMSGLIQTEEDKAEFRWPYKAEVVFAMAKPVPLPMLATSETSKKKYGEDLPQSRNPFARPSREDWIKHKVKRIRRPDIILVEKTSKRWPGREATYFDGKFHDDNLKMLIEVKFPGDTLSKGQDNDYTLIATESRFGVLRVEDNRTEKQKEYDKAYNTTTQPSAERYAFSPLQEGEQPRPVPVLPPEGAPGSIPQPLHKNLPLLSTSPWDFMPSVEDWVRFGNEVSSLAEEGWEYVSTSTRQMFHQFGAWVSEKGDWFCQQVLDPLTQQTHYVFSWMSKQTGEIITWSVAQCQDLLRTVLLGSEITLEYLKQIEWVQVLSDIGNGTVQLVIQTAVTAAVIIVTLAVAAALVVLVAIVAAAIAAGGSAAAALFAALATVGGGTLAVAQ
ncbi:VRR-NUC domain-containing protein [Serratia fonticola]|uniref:VRR-NUC domain-containing protein n=1 Tax=Serratia fonticola TaxID=47917 RepID=A0A542BFB1_SERFO|nr:VRR-NUC domain-containing protein [Serratia fonticola]TQI77262.1 VRR-NUC domain-containing protein [Serratia fonticola]TQI93612.1 VRR-NUC domain-containing protein [Serratia fonticola]TVZ61642.1 VRR-NUC domain-containing protein [Serratia fonticola]